MSMLDESRALEALPPVNLDMDDEAQEDVAERGFAEIGDDVDDMEEDLAADNDEDLAKQEKEEAENLARRMQNDILFAIQGVG